MQRGLQIMKNKVTSRSGKIAAEQAKIDALLKKVGYKGGGGSVHKVPDYETPVPNLAKCSNIVTYTPHSRVRKKYTGDEIIGIAVMHKSNAVPIRSKKTAEEVAKMRRG